MPDSLRSYYMGLSHMDPGIELPLQIASPELAPGIACLIDEAECE